MSRIANPRPFTLDPFFDGVPGSTQPASTPVSAPLPGTENYRDAATEQLADGRPVTDRMPAAVRGIRGSIIPGSTPGGAVRGLNLHNVRSMEVTIDPHISGQSSVVRLGDINPERMAAANMAVAQAMPLPDSIQTQRLVGAAVMHQFAMSPANGNGSRPQTISSSTIPSPHLARMGQPVRAVRPLQAFANNPAAQPGESPVQQQLVAPAAPSQALPPTLEVTFEIEHFGTHRAVYHDVIVEPGFIVLVYKTAYRGSRYFPETARADAPPMALHVEGRPQVYLVHTTGVHYVYDDAEFCVLLVERAATLPDEPAAE